MRFAICLTLTATCTAFLAPLSKPIQSAGLRSVIDARSISLSGYGLRTGSHPFAFRPSTQRNTINLQMYDKVKAEYVWIGGRGGVGDDYRCKTRILDKAPTSVEELPLWNYDGSSTGQAPGSDSEVFLKPVFMCPDPMRGGPHILVMCEMLKPDMTPIPTNTRNAAKQIFDQGIEEEPWYGIEQEYTLFKDGAPLGW